MGCLLFTVMPVTPWTCGLHRRRKHPKKVKFRAQHRCLLGRNMPGGNPAAVCVKPHCCCQQRTVPTPWVNQVGNRDNKL